MKRKDLPLEGLFAVLDGLEMAQRGFDRILNGDTLPPRLVPAIEDAAATLAALVAALTRRISFYEPPSE